MGDRNMCKFPSVGPATRRINKIWDEKGRTEIVQIIITYTKGRVDSLQFLYNEEGNLVLSDVFGDNRDTSCFEVVKFKYPSEYITCVSGLYDNIDSKLLSIKFTTNMGTYGPFGDTSPAKFPKREYRFCFGEDRVFGGFHGYADSTGFYGITLGVYVKLPITLNVVDQNAVAFSRRRN